MSKLETPAGHKVEMRKLTVAEEDILTDIKLSKQGKSLDTLLAACVKSEMPLKKMLIGDRVFLIIKLRAMSKGNIYEARLKCDCSEAFPEDIDLEKLKIQKLNKDNVEIDDKGRYVFWTDPLPVSKKKFKLRLLIGDDEDRLTELRKEYPKEFMSRLLLLRIVEIEGEKMINIKMIKELDSMDSQFLRETYDDHDCGIDTEIEVMCPDCYTELITNLPIDQVGFFLPHRKKKKKIN